MDWTDLCITLPKAEADTAEAIATGISGSGIYIEDYSDLEAQVEAIAHVDLIEQALLDKDRTEVAVHLYLAPEEDAAPVIELLHSRLTAAGLHYQLRASGVRQEDWENGWKAYYHAIEIGRRLAVVPSWEQYDPASGRTVLRLDPGMAFGTGTHETTALCLETLDAWVQGGERVLDVGTGSGILAIAALKLGAAEADGVDIDPMCVRTATENAELNGVAGRFAVRVGDLAAQARGPYQIITANIVANAILHLAPAIPPLLTPGGRFVASGIIDTRRDEVIAGLAAAGLAVDEVREKNGWVALRCSAAAPAQS